MPVKIFFCYAHEDEALLNILKTHLRPLQRLGLIEVWHDRDISAGTKWEEEINTHLNEANIILLLVSPDFMDSDYCYGKEMKRALERDKQGEARVIPIILRPVYWQGLLGTLQALPTDAKPIMSSSWHYQDEAFFNVSEGIRKVAEMRIDEEDQQRLSIEKLLTGIRAVYDHLDNTIADVARYCEQFSWAELLQLMEDVSSNPRDNENITRLARKGRLIKTVFQLYQIVLNTLAQGATQLRSLID